MVDGGGCVRVVWMDREEKAPKEEGGGVRMALRFMGEIMKLCIRGGLLVDGACVSLIDRNDEYVSFFVFRILKPVMIVYGLQVAFDALQLHPVV